MRQQPPPTPANPARWRRWAPLAVAVVLLAACGTDQQAAPETTATAEATATASPTPAASPSPTPAAPTPTDRETGPRARDAGVDRVVEVEMSEFAFEPDRIRVEADSTVRFVFHNVGEVEHEAVIGDQHVQDEHAQQMAAGEGGDGHHHADVASITVAPGETGALTVEVDGPEDLLIGCHIPGHYDAGMVADLLVRR